MGIGWEGVQKMAVTTHTTAIAQHPGQTRRQQTTGKRRAASGCPFFFLQRDFATFFGGAS